MSESRYLIKLAADSRIEGIGFVAVVSQGGLPLSNATVLFRVEGHGTLDAFTDKKEEEQQTNEDGQAFSTWWEYPRYRPRRELKASLTASCETGGAAVSLGTWSEVVSQV